MTSRNPWVGRVGKAARDAQRPELPGAAAGRIAHRAAAEQAHRETMTRFGPLTPENVREAIAWQESRIAEIRGTP